MKRITLSGDIGWEVTPQGVREELAAANGGDVEIFISSRGGLVGAALEIFNMIRNYPGHVTAILSGYAMSAASYIPMAANKVVAEDNAVMMIHNAQGLTWGDHNEMLKYGNILKGLSGLLANAYAKFTGKDRPEIDALMDAETWLFGEAITAAGFAHETIPATSQDDADQTSAMARARLAFAEITNKLAADKTAFQSDLTLAAAMAAGSTNHGGGAPQPRTPTTTENSMDLKKLKAEFPDLVAALIAEATAGFKDQLTAARQEGAAAEQQRIAAVRAQAIPGHEPLIEALAADGKSTGADAAMAIVAAEKTLRAKAAADSQAGNQPAVPAIEQQAGGKTIKRAEFDAMSQDGRRAHLTVGGKVID